MTSNRPGGQLRSPGTTLLTASCGTLLVLIDYTSPLTTLSPTAAALHIGSSAQTWVLTGTLVGLAALLLTAGSAADDYGRKRVFGSGAVLLLASTALSAAAPNTALFLTGRVLQGCAAAAILAPTPGTDQPRLPRRPSPRTGPGHVGRLGRSRHRAGPCVRGAHGAGRRLALPVLGAGRTVASLVLLTVLGLDESKTERPRRLDPLGVLALASGSSCLIAGLSEGRHGWGRGIVLELLAVGVLLLIAFALVESRVVEPMLDLALFRNPGFIASSSGALFTGLSIVGLMSYLPTVLQKSLGESSLAASGVLDLVGPLSGLRAAGPAAGQPAGGHHAGRRILAALRHRRSRAVRAGCRRILGAPGPRTRPRRHRQRNPQRGARPPRGQQRAPAPGRDGIGCQQQRALPRLRAGRRRHGNCGEPGQVGRRTAHAMAAGANNAVLVAAAICLLGAAIALWARTAEARAARDAAPSEPAAQKTGTPVRAAS